MFKNTKQIIICISAVHFLMSCTTTYIYKSPIPTASIDSLLLFAPISEVSLIEKGDRAIFDKRMSKLSSEHLSKGVKEELNSKVVILNIHPDSLTNKKIEKEIIQLVYGIENNGALSKVTIPEFINTIMKLNGLDYAMCIYQSGYTRSGSNYGARIALGVVLGLLMGVVVIPEKAYSQVYCIVLDSKNNNMAFYRKSFLQGEEPVDKRTTDKQLKNLFRGYFGILK